MAQTPQDRPLQLAAIVTAYFAISHADVMISRWLEPRETDARRCWPPEGPRRSTIASLHIVPSSHPPVAPYRPDIGVETAKRHGVRLCDSIEEALTLGTGSIAVDGVLLIGEHGDYPQNALDQKEYPRYELFREITDLLQAHGRVIPMFLDKHWSYKNDRVLEMESIIESMKMPFLAGSSLTHCGFQPPIVPPAQVRETVSVFYGEVESYGFHSLDIAEAVLEKRSGAQKGIVKAGVWDDASTLGDLDEELVRAALRVPSPGRTSELNLDAPLAELLKGVLAFRLEYADGVRATHLLVNGHLPEFVFAVRDQDGAIQAGRAEGGEAEDFYNHFAALNLAIEDMVVNGTTPVPRQRTLVTSWAINSLMELRQSNPGQWVDLVGP